MAKKKSITHQQMNVQNWRYKKKTAPTDEFASRNGPVKIIKPATNKPRRYYDEAMRNAAYEYARQMRLGKHLRDIV